MKKILSILIFFLLLSSLVACVNASTTLRSETTRDYSNDHRYDNMGSGFTKIDLNSLEKPDIYVDDMIEADDFKEDESYKMVVHTNENGPFIDGIIIYSLNEIKESTAISLSYIGSVRTKYELKEIYRCNPDCTKTNEDSNYYYGSFEIDTKHQFPVINSNREPYETPFNDFTEDYELVIDSKTFKYKGLEFPDLYGLSKGECMFDDIDMSFMAFENIEEDNIKNPLIIWLHGGGEGGTEPEVAVIGNEVPALFRNEIQNYFKKDGSNGAYVFIPECETMWMDSTGKDTSISINTYTWQSSYYTEYLMASILSYIEYNEDIDTSRIYVGGCSNGGYMTLELAFQFPDFFAAIYPICPGYDNTNVSIEMIQSLRDLPIWFVQSIDDGILSPKKYGEPIYARLIEAGNDNCFYTMYDKIRGKDMPNVNYIGHFSWVYLFNNEVKNVQKRENIKYDLGPDKNYGFNGIEKGGTETTGFDGIWDWMSNQKKENK